MTTVVAGCRSNWTGNYKAVLFLDSVCSIAPPPNGTFVPTANDTMEFSIIFRVEDHPTLQNSSTNSVGTGLTYTPGVQWAGLETITVTEYFQTTYLYTNQTVCIVSVYRGFPPR